MPFRDRGREGRGWLRGPPPHSPRIALCALALSAATVLLTIAPGAAPAAGSAAPPVTEFPTSVESPYAITKGPDGNLWFEGTSELGKVTPAGTITRITGVPNVDVQGPDEITAGPDGNIWFTTFKPGTGDGVGKINPTSLAYNEYSVGSDCGLVRGIVPGPDGRLWFACDDSLEGHIGAITTSGTVSLYSTGYDTSPIGLAVGSDGNIWFITRSTFGKMTTSGAVTVYKAVLSGPPLGGIASGPDGNLWIAESGVDLVAKITIGATFTYTEYPVGPAGDEYGPWAITAGPDGNLWFSNGDPLEPDTNNNSADRIGKITTSGVVTDYVSTAGISLDSQPDGITAGPDGNIWFTEEAGRIGRLDLHATTPTPTPTPTPKPAPAPKPKKSPKPTSTYPASIGVLASVKGSGHITGGSINCPGHCTAKLTKTNRRLKLTAVPSPGYRFAGWSGLCPGKLWGLGPCTMSVLVYSGNIVYWGATVGGNQNLSEGGSPMKLTAIFVKGP
jgi:streptogramin lyase